MSYQVIARKYRPQRFEEVVGQDHVTRTLANAIKQKRIAHAYLFAGPRGTGKTTLARIFAKCLNCTDGPRTDFPDDDPKCREIAEGRSMDVIEIDGASNRGIEEIRELRETVKYAPSSSAFKIYIIDEVHMLTKEAFNALLKTLEEPPSHVKFMFATTEPEKVLPTILSRCQRFDLGRIRDSLIVEHLQKIAELEQVQIDPPALSAIARGADGGMRDAASTLDQLISFCGDKIVETDVLAVFGLTGRDRILNLSEALIDGDTGATLSILNELADSGKDLWRLLADIQEHMRNLMILKVAPHSEALLSAFDQDKEALKRQSAKVTQPGVMAMLECLNQAESQFRQASSKRIHLELALIKTMEARHSQPLDHVLGMLKGSLSPGSAPPPPFENRAWETAQASPTQSDAADSKRPSMTAAPRDTASTRSTRSEKPVNPPSPGAPTHKTAPRKKEVALHLTGKELESFWQEVVEAIGKASPFAKTYFIEAHAVSFENGVLTLGFDPEFSDHITLVDNTKNKTLIQNKVMELGRGKPMVKFIEAQAPGRLSQPKPLQTEPEPPSPSPNPSGERKTPSDPVNVQPESIDFNQFKDDPLIREALELFKGHIVDVRK